MDKLMMEEWRGRCLMCSELVALQLGHILSWYFGDVPQPKPERV
jgi:hypothetical protein